MFTHSREYSIEVVASPLLIVIVGHVKVAENIRPVRGSPASDRVSDTRPATHPRDENIATAQGQRVARTSIKSRHAPTLAKVANRTPAGFTAGLGSGSPAGAASWGVLYSFARVGFCQSSR